MKARYEFRLRESPEVAKMVEGTRSLLLSDTVRMVTLEPSEARFEALRLAEISARRRGRSLFSSWDVRRSYTRAELEAAELVNVISVGAFEPEGEACGTEYDESAACLHCGTGRIQRSSLALDLRSRQPEHDVHTTTLHRGKDLARSIADEVVVSDRFVAWYAGIGGRGARFDPVVRCRTGREVEGWRQLVVTAPLVDVAEATVSGVDPFDLDETGEYRCPLGHVLGLNLLSELTIERASWRGDDIMATRQQWGRRVGVLVPAPEYLVSQRFFRVLRDGGARGLRFEVAHLT